MGNEAVLKALISSFRPFDPDTNQFEPNASKLWTHIVTSAACQKYCLTEVCSLLDQNIDRIHDFADELDELHRRVVNMALPQFKQAIEERMLFLRRFALKEGPEEHRSATCIVKIAVDRSRKNIPVAMKFMMNRGRWVGS